MRWNKKCWTIAGFLIVAILLSIGILAGNIHYTKADKNTINLVASSRDDEAMFITAEEVAAEAEALEQGERLLDSVPVEIAYTPATETAMANPGMQVEDENGLVWSYSATPIEIFHKEYGGDYPITVLTNNGDKLIAPGTTEEYTFSLKNTGDVPLTYKMWVESYIDPEAPRIPIEVKMKDSSGSWLTGSEADWAEFLSLNDVSDEGTLAVSSYANYSLSWLWPYESGDDPYDTWLGNRAVDEDLSVKIIIHVMACYDENVQTGDDTNSYLYTASIILACIVLAVFVIWYAKRRKKQQQAA